MKFLISLLALLLAGCTSRMPLGECVGINGQKDPKLHYEYNATNIVVGLIFVESIVVPIVVVLDELECPTMKALPNEPVSSGPGIQITITTDPKPVPNPSPTK